MRLQVVKVDVASPGVPVRLPGLGFLLLLGHVGLEAKAPDLHVLYVEGGVRGELDGVEGVHVTCGAALAEVAGQHQTK